VKIQALSNENEAVGISNEIAITFEANAVAFYAQISGLAQDKIGYPMRELNTNAWDATRARYGDDVPDDKVPTLTLPTHLDPRFVVRDFGHGMNRDQMIEVYARMYASTKRESTEEVGGWGLGRFSCFAYLIGDNGAASYRVTSVAEEADGRRMKTIWSISISRNGTPVLREMMNVETDEETGLEVSFDVRRGDIETFTHKARKILWSFNPRPRITPDFHWEEPVVQSAGNGWTYFTSGSVPFRGPHVRMGCVMYPISLYSVPGANVFLKDNDPVLFEAPIGSVSVTLSRENLAYDERTVATLTDLIQKYTTEFSSRVQAKIDEAVSFFDACRIFEEETKMLGSGRSGTLRGLINWRGRRLPQTIDCTSEIKFMVLGSGWVPFDKFDRMAITPANLAGHEIVIEHNPSYSWERFAAADLVGKPVLWVRCKRDHLLDALATLGDPDSAIASSTRSRSTAPSATRTPNGSGSGGFWLLPGPAEPRSAPRTSTWMLAASS
jgi:hypothetical protein